MKKAAVDDEYLGGLNLALADVLKPRLKLPDYQSRSQDI